MNISSKLFLAVVFTLGFSAGLAGIFLFSNHAPAFLRSSANSQQYCALSVKALFSPHSQDEFVGIVDSAKESVDVMLYQFSNPAMKDSLVRAVKRGVAVRLILEPRVDSNYATASFLAQNGIVVKWASKSYTNTHSKSAVIDNTKVLVGSTNWSRQAMASNRESTVLIESEYLANSFELVFEEDWAKASEYVLKRKASDTAIGGNSAVEGEAVGVAG